MSEAASTARAPRLLLLEDSDFDAELITEHAFKVRPKPSVTRAVGRRDFVRALEGEEEFDVILSDYSLPDFDGMAALDMALEKAPNTPFIFVSGVLGEEIAIESFKKGATDYVLKQRLIRLPAAIERAVAEAREKTERRHAESRLQLLVAELSHRVKNTLAMVMSIARRTATSSETVEQYEQALTSRLRALSEAHALLFEANWGDTTLEQVLQRTLDPFRREGDGSISVCGPQVTLEPKAALALSLVFHELVTNAAKYGALSRDEGMVSIEWKLVVSKEASRVNLTWSETGGPSVTQPEHSGFGTTLVDRSIRYELDGEVDFSYAPAGMQCRIQFAAA